MPITVRELIEALSEQNQDLPVKTMGCDCTGTASEVYQDGNVVIIDRED